MSSISLNSRLRVLDMIQQSKEGHVASSFSIIEILAAVYESMRLRGHHGDFLSHLILSKGHAAYALYGVMNSVGLLSDDELSRVGTPGSYLIGHVPHRPSSGFYVGTGSLGQGLPMAVGRAFGRRLAGDPVPEYVIVGDGEMNEGSCWESLLLMKKFPNLQMRVIIDNNGSSTRAIPMQDVFAAIRCGWRTVDVDGHNVDEMVRVLSDDTQENIILIANTVKGFPVERMKNNPAWHHRMPTDVEAAEIAAEMRVHWGDQS